MAILRGGPYPRDGGHQGGGGSGASSAQTNSLKTRRIFVKSKVVTTLRACCARKEPALRALSEEVAGCSMGPLPETCMFRLARLASLSSSPLVRSGKSSGGDEGERQHGLAAFSRSEQYWAAEAISPIAKDLGRPEMNGSGFDVGESMCAHVTDFLAAGDIAYPISRRKLSAP